MPFSIGRYLRGSGLRRREETAIKSQLAFDTATDEPHTTMLDVKHPLVEYDSEVLMNVVISSMKTAVLK